ncbi:MAG: type II toxin-antitoxin system VapC family toxin [Acidobacteria bacterium]|nr:type II toxin-antitoxin system VapC family toxin [Acidobacteriota bacterium]
MRQRLQEPRPPAPHEARGARRVGSWRAPARAPGNCAAALDLALDHGLSVYDAVYAVLARTLAAPLVTADGRLLAALRKAGIAALPLA